MAELDLANPSDRAALSGLVAEYGKMLHRHIREEDGEVFPLAVSRLSDAVMEEIGRHFDRFEDRETEAGAVQALADVPVARYR